jgi:hypothetical protein
VGYALGKAMANAVMSRAKVSGELNCGRFSVRFAPLPAPFHEKMVGFKSLFFSYNRTFFYVVIINISF